MEYQTSKIPNTIVEEGMVKIELIVNCDYWRKWVTTTKKTKISEGYLVRENVKSLSNFVTKFCDQGICEEFHFFRH